MRTVVTAVSGLAMTLALGVACAQDPPSRVARLNWTAGTVSFQPAGVDTWTEATLNYPLTTGDHLYTDSGARAEMHVGANALRLEHESNFGFLNLDDRTVQVRFTEGSLEVRLRRLEDDDLYEIDTPNGAVTLLRTGDYRIDTDPGRNATMVTVFSGNAEVTANGMSVPVRPRETAYFADGRDADVRELNPADDFDRFTAARNTREDRLPPPVHVSQGMSGYEDLDQYGAWSEAPDYGWVWTPRVAAGWTPYSVGRWAWVEPWGWTWVDEEPWGFAPFHYGRWALAGGGWVWVPGTVVARPVYAPALVVFAGGGRIGAGAVAWFPLGPREVYRPVYAVSPRYLREVNVTHVTNISVTNVTYVNQRSVTVIPQSAFIAARPVHGVAQQVDARDARVLGTAPPVAPERQSIAIGPRAGSVAQPRDTVMSRPVVARTAPPAPPVNFEARRQALAASEGRPLAPQQVQEIRRQAPEAVVNRPPVRVAAPAVRAPAPAVTDRFETRPAARPMESPRAVAPPVRPDARPEIRQQPRPEARPEPRPAAAERRVERPAPAAREERRQERREEKKEDRKEEKKP